MKKILCIACLTVALNLNTGYANAQSGRGAFISGFLTELGTEAARGIIRIMRTPRPDADVKKTAFTDNEWLVAIDQNGNDFIYYGVNLKTSDSLSLRGATVSANSTRQVYSWNNGDYRYQVA